MEEIKAEDDLLWLGHHLSITLGGTGGHSDEGEGPWLRRVAALTALVIAAGSVTTRADLEDYRRIAVAHQRLLDEARMVAGTVLNGELAVVVRDELTLPLLEVAASPVGLPKIVFIRNYDPYGLVDTAALFEWVLADETVKVENIVDWGAQCDGLSGRVLIHRDGGFVDAGNIDDVGEEARRWRSAGRGVQVVQELLLP